jgi:hypothetical protein
MKLEQGMCLVFEQAADDPPPDWHAKAKRIWEAMFCGVTGDHFADWLAHSARFGALKLEVDDDLLDERWIEMLARAYAAGWHAAALDSQRRPR